LSKLRIDDFCNFCKERFKEGETVFVIANAKVTAKKFYDTPNELCKGKVRANFLGRNSISVGVHYDCAEKELQKILVRKIRKRRKCKQLP